MVLRARSFRPATAIESVITLVSLALSVKAADTVKLVFEAIAEIVLVSPETVIVSPTASSVVKAVPTPVTVVDAAGSIEPVSTPVPAVSAASAAVSVNAASTVKAVLLPIAVTFLISPLTFILSPTANSVEKAVPTPVTDVDAVGSIEPVNTREVPVPVTEYPLEGERT